MSAHPVGDQIKVLVSSDMFGFGGQKKGVESGVVVEVPDELLYLGFHNFGFDNSLANKDVLESVQNFYRKFKDKRVFWESLQDRGRRFVEGDKEYVYIKMTDIIFYTDSPDEDIQLAQEGGFAA